MVTVPPWAVVQSMLLTVVLPGLAIGAAWPAAVCATTRSETKRTIGAALGLAGGLALGNLTRGLLPWWSLEWGWPSLFPATLLALAGGVIAACAATGPATRGLIWRLLTTAGCAFWLAPGGPFLVHLGYFVFLWLASALNWEMLRRHGGQSLGPAALLAFILPWGVAAATVLIHAHSARFCDLALLQTVTVIGVGLVAAWRRLNVTALSAAPAVFFPALVLGGATNTFSDVPAASFVLLALAPGALSVLHLPPMRHWSGRARAAAALGAVLVPCLIAVALALRFESLEFGE